MNDELRAITKNQRSFDSAVMMSSLMPSEKYSCSGSPLMLVNGSTAMAGRSGSGMTLRACASPMRLRAGAAGDEPMLDAHSHVADEAKALARDGADQPLLLAAVADRLARGIDAAGQRRFRNDAAAPDRVDKVVLADDALAVLHQVIEQVEHLRLDGNRVGAAPQLAPVRVEHMIAKEKLHVAAPFAISNLGLSEIIKAVSKENQALTKSFARSGRTHNPIMLEIGQELSMPAATLTAEKPHQTGRADRHLPTSLP